MVRYFTRKSYKKGINSPSDLQGILLFRNATIPYAKANRFKISVKTQWSGIEMMTTSEFINILYLSYEIWCMEYKKINYFYIITVIYIYFTFHKTTKYNNPPWWVEHQSEQITSHLWKCYSVQFVLWQSLLIICIYRIFCVFKWPIA